MSPQVLLVSRDAMLLQTRQLILGAFFRAKGAGRVREAEDLISTQWRSDVEIQGTFNVEGKGCSHEKDEQAASKIAVAK